MDSKAKISDVIKKLQSVLEREGDLPVYSVNFHSDYRCVEITKENINDQIRIDLNESLLDDETEEPFLLIYGGSY